MAKSENILLAEKKIKKYIQMMADEKPGTKLYEGLGENIDACYAIIDGETIVDGDDIFNFRDMYYSAAGLSCVADNPAANVIGKTISTEGADSEIVGTKLSNGLIYVVTESGKWIKVNTKQ